MHLRQRRAAVKAYAATAGATATINQATIVYNDPGAVHGRFSSRGPLLAGGGDLLKPDVIAPGQDILAAVAPPGNGGRDFDLYSGTSMSSPHVAGLAALLKDLHPDWTPMMIKSALMTSAYDVLDGPNTNPLVIFRQGAGHVKPNSAADPGLVFNAGWNDWLAFLCGNRSCRPATCARSGTRSLDPSDFNGASIAIGDLAGAQTVTRTVTNVGGARPPTPLRQRAWPASTVDVSPPAFTLAPGRRRRPSPSLHPHDGGAQRLHRRPAHLDRRQRTTCASRSSSGRSPSRRRPRSPGAHSYNVTFGYTARSRRGARARPGHAHRSTTRPTAPAQQLAKRARRGVPAGTTYARFSLFDADVDAGSDLDLCVFNAAARWSARAAAAPPPRRSTSSTRPPAPTPSSCEGWASRTPPVQALHLGPRQHRRRQHDRHRAGVRDARGHGTIDLTFSGLTAGTKYLGSVAYSGAAGMPNPTIVRVDVP